MSNQFVRMVRFLQKMIAVNGCIYIISEYSKDSAYANIMYLQNCIGCGDNCASSTGQNIKLDVSHVGHVTPGQLKDILPNCLFQINMNTIRFILKKYFYSSYGLIPSYITFRDGAWEISRLWWRLCGSARKYFHSSPQPMKYFTWYNIICKTIFILI